MVDKVRKNKRTLTVLPTVASFCALLALVAPSCGDSAKRLTSDDSLYLAEIARAERDGTPVPQHPAAAQPQNAQPVLDTVWPEFPYTSIDDAPYDEIFNDSNRYQYAFAERVGISPIHTIGQAYFTRRPVVKVVSGAHYVVDSLSHSVPFLVPQAAKLLDDIGAAFIENLKKKVDAGANYIVTQMFFDNSKFFQFVDKCRAQGINVPIVPGLKPISTFKHLEMLPRTFSIDIPHELVKEIRSCKNNKEINQVGIEWCVAQSKELIAHGVPAVHYYTMGKSENIQEIVKQVF